MESYQTGLLDLKGGMIRSQEGAISGSWEQGDVFFVDVQILKQFFFPLGVWVLD